MLHIMVFFQNHFDMKLIFKIMQVIKFIEENI